MRQVGGVVIGGWLPAPSHPLDMKVIGAALSPEPVIRTAAKIRNLGLKKEVSSC